jgi:hypothetical protein
MDNISTIIIYNRFYILLILFFIGYSEKLTDWQDEEVWPICSVQVCVYSEKN